jgi:nucleoside-diphosphate-sugar epimerase
VCKIFVFGSNGFVGRAICNLLKTVGETIVEIDRRAFLGFKNNPNRFRDMLDPTDIIIFCSAIVPAIDSEDFSDNIMLVKDFIEIIGSSQFQYLLNLSSDAVYGDYGRPISESDDPKPASIHGMMHFSREFLLNHSYSQILGNLRPSLIYGPGDSHNSYGPNRFIRQGLANSPIQVYGEGEERRDHIFIEDVARIVYKMTQSRVIGNLNAATGKIVDYKTIAFDVQSKIPNSQVIFIDRIQTSLPHNGYREFDISKLRTVVADDNLVDIKNGITKTLLKGI